MAASIIARCLAVQVLLGGSTIYDTDIRSWPAGRPGQPLAT
jgi:hypothetical protein